MNVSVHCREERCIGNAWYIPLLNTEFHLCGWLPSCLYTCNLPFLRLHSISPCLLRQVRVKDKDCGRSPRQVESHQVAISRLIKFLMLFPAVYEYWYLIGLAHLQVVPDLGRLAWVPSHSWSLIAKGISCKAPPVSFSMAIFTHQ